MSEVARPALRFQNPNPAGLNFIKFDVAQENERGDGIDLMMIQSRLPLWCEAGRRASRRILKRVAEALRQNPDYSATFVFSKLPVVAGALAFIDECGHKGKISAGLAVPDDDPA